MWSGVVKVVQRILWIHTRRVGPGRSIDDDCGTERSDGTRPGHGIQDLVEI